MVRLVIHGGFHKTGTTTLQRVLRTNRSALRPLARIVLRPGMVGLCEAARAYSVSRAALDLGLVTYEAANLAEDWVGADCVILSSEDLAGHMPGRRGLQRYDAAPSIFAAIDKAFREVLGNVEIQYLFTTRAPRPWLASCYGQHLGASRIRMSSTDYVRKYRSSANLDAVVDEVAKSVPKSQVHRAALEQHSDGLGPAEPLLNLARIPEALKHSLVAVPAANTAPKPARAAALLHQIIRRASLRHSHQRATNWLPSGSDAVFIQTVLGRV